MLLSISFQLAFLVFIFYPRTVFQIFLSNSLFTFAKKVPTYFTWYENQVFLRVAKAVFFRYVWGLKNLIKVLQNEFNTRRY